MNPPHESPSGRSDNLAMTQARLAERIRRSLGTMSPRLRQVAEYVLTHHERVSFLPAARLGRMIGVSEATVVRFAMALGYSGYAAFQEAVQEIVKSQLTTVDRLELAGRPNGAQSMAARIIEADIENLRVTLRSLDDSTFQAAVSAIMKARRILVVGFRGAASLALFLGLNLNWILGNVKVAGFTAQDLWEDLVHLKRGDLVIGISFPRYTDATVRAIAEAQKQGSTIIALTDGVLSPLSQYADVVLTARHTIPTYADSFVAPLSIINALLAATGAADKPRTTRELRRLEVLWDRCGVYYRPANRSYTPVTANGTEANRIAAK